MPQFISGLPSLNRSSNLNARVRPLWAATAVAAAAVMSALSLAGAAPALATDRIGVIPGPDGAVNGISEPDANGTRYLGGAFKNFNAIATGNGALTDGTTGAIDLSFPQIGFGSGTLEAAAADGSGGLYIAGSGQIYGDGGPYWGGDVLTHSGVAHINADGSLDTSWNPNVDGRVMSIAVSGSTVYFSGSFTTVGGITRNNAAAVDRTSGALKSWNPDPNSTVRTLTVSGSTAYLGGDFTSVGGAGGATRTRLAAVDATTGAATGWDPDVNGTVAKVAVSGSTVYVGGTFTTVGATTRKYLAAVDATTGTATSWNPNPNSIVEALAVSGSTVYVGGYFSEIGSANRFGAGAIDATTGTATSWNPNSIYTGAIIESLVVSGSTVYLGGNFYNFGSSYPFKHAAAVGTDGSARSWNPNPSNSVRSIVVLGSNVFIGGGFDTAGGTPRRFAAAVGYDGKITSWNPVPDGIVHSISLSGSTVLLGGDFRKVNGTRRDYFAAIGTDGTLLPTWYGGTGPGSTPAPTPTPTPDPTPTPTPTPTTKPAKPTATWSSSAKAKTVTAVITPVVGVTYALTATSGRVKKTGSCKNVTITQGKKKLARRSCTIKLAKGNWLASVTPKNGSVSGTVNSKSYSFK
jgi:hypothetical protein